MYPNELLDLGAFCCYGALKLNEQLHYSHSLADGEIIVLKLFLNHSNTGCCERAECSSLTNGAGALLMSQTMCLVPPACSDARSDLPACCAERPHQRHLLLTL